jgi:hypothetical protein
MIKVNCEQILRKPRHPAPSYSCSNFTPFSVLNRTNFFWKKVKCVSSKIWNVMVITYHCEDRTEHWRLVSKTELNSPLCTCANEVITCNFPVLYSSSSSLSFAFQ